MSLFILMYLYFAAGVPAIRPPEEASGQAGIRAGEVERIIRYLSSDEMRGRASFTPENDAAASFIAGEFRKAGLKPMAPYDRFEQVFSLRRLQPESSSVVIDGMGVDPARIIVSSTIASLDWSEEDSLPVIPMGEHFDRSLFRTTSKGIILVPTVHAEWFRRFREYYDGPSIDGGDREERAFVAVLTDVVQPESYRVTYRARVDTPLLQNVVGVLPGEKGGGCILFSAHYDHIGVVDPVDGDSIANGADDDASGTTGVIGLAQYFSSLGTPGRTLVFAAFAGEELGGHGSRQLASVIDPDTVVAMINMEMIGSPSEFGPGTFWITGYERSSLGRIVSDALEGSEYRAFPDPYPAQNLFFRSDNASFARLGVPAHSFSTHRMDTDSIYHTVHDGIGQIDLGVLTATIRAIAAGVKPLVAGEKTPTRILSQGE